MKSNQKKEKKTQPMWNKNLTIFYCKEETKTNKAMIRNVLKIGVEDIINN
jgi:hypothetical protein